MSDKPEIPRAINILIGLGIVAPFIIFILFGVGIGLYIQYFNTPKTTPTGEYGATCGGSNRLPCRPGLVCSVGPAEWATKTGTCVTDTRAVFPPGQAGDVCDTERGCAPGLLCDRIGVATGTCTAVTTSSRP